MSQFKQLRSFVTVVTSGSLTTSAKALKLSKSTLSRHLKKLEEDVGYMLLKREPSRLVATEAGLSYYYYAEQILQAELDAQQALARLDEKVQGELVLYVDNGLLRGWFSEVVAQFLSRFPDVSVTLRTDLIHAYEHHRDSIVLTMGEISEQNQRQEKLCLLWQGVFGSERYFKRNGYPQSPGELMSHQWLHFIGGPTAQIELFNQQNESVSVLLPESRVRSDQLVLHGDAITHSHGVGLFPLWQARMRLKAHPGCFERCLGDWVAEPIPVWLSYPYGKLARKHKAFIEHIRSNLPSNDGNGLCEIKK